MIAFPPGQDEIDPGFLDLLVASARAYGSPLEVTSGRQGRPTTPGSMHPHGRAVDLSMAGMDDIARAKLVETLRAQGVRRFGTYTNTPDMLHADMSDAQGGNWYMHDKTNRNLGNAPAWFQSIANYKGSAQAPDVRQAAATTGLSTDTDRIPSGDPVTGRAVPPRASPMFPTMPQQAPAEQESSWATPLVALLGGLAMGGGPLEGLAAAGYGLGESAKAENELLELKQRRQDAARRRQSQDSIDVFGQQLEQHPDPQMRQVGAMIRMNPEAGFRIYSEMQTAQAAAAQRQPLVQQLRDMGDERGAVMAGLGYSPGAAPATSGGEYGLTPQIYQTPEGKTMERVYAKDGSYVDREIPGTPTRYDPNVASAVAQGQAAGKVKGTSAAETAIALPETLAKIDQSIAVLDNLLAHGGREWATGWQGSAPKIAGTPQADYINKLEQLGGANFLQAYETLKGGGQITEIEGQKATKAISDLDRTQTDEEHRKSLETLLGVFEIARRRALAKAGRAAPQEPMQAVPTAPAGDLTPEEQAELERLRGAK